jgi:hypothetical protein
VIEADIPNMAGLARANRTQALNSLHILARNWKFESSPLQRRVMQTIGSSAARISLPTRKRRWDHP